MKFADSHAHLNHPKFNGDIDGVAEKLREDKFLVLNVAYDLDSAGTAIELAKRYENMRASAGIHPHDAGSITDADFEKLEQLAAHERVAAIGETGLDYFRNLSPKDAQQNALKRHLEIANKNKKPVIIHCRDAFADIVPILQEHFDPQIGGVLHCFSEGPEEAEIGLKLGFHISFAGNVTYKKADRIKEAAKTIPSDRLLVETDCPYLAPQSKRGKRNEPSLIIETAKMLGQLRNASLEDIARVTYVNYQKLFLAQDQAEGEIVYKIRDSIYVNITNDCSNLCEFCPRVESPFVMGHYLGLRRNPSASEILEAIGSQKPVEVVFCGFGEPTMQLDVVKEVAAEMKKRNIKVRLNTNGQGNLINKRDIVPELAGLIDTVSISLNAPDSETYDRICKPNSPKAAFVAVCDFIVRARDRLPETVVTAVDLPEGVNIEDVRRLAEDKLKVKFRRRNYNMTGEADNG